MEHLHLIGKSLSVNEEAALQSSLPLLWKQHQIPDATTSVTFWGKVEGYKKDYLIARVESVKLHECTHVNYFSNDSGHHWSELPVISLLSDESVLCDSLRGLYIGEPQFEYKICKDSAEVGGNNGDNANPIVGSSSHPSNDVVLPDMNDELLDAEKELRQMSHKSKNNKMNNANRHEQEDEEEEEEEEEDDDEDDEEDDDDMRLKQRKWNTHKKNKKNNNDDNDKSNKNTIKEVIVCIPESMRLAHFVESHDNECRLALRGQYILRGNAIGEVNTRFHGHSLSHAMQLSCYMHHDYNTHKIWADPGRNKEIYGASYDPQTDYLVPISEDIPDGVWCIRYHPSINILSVQNLLFDESLFWYEPNTTHFGQVYYGDGQRTLDLCFTL